MIERLFGLPGAEVLYDNAETVYESEIDGVYEAPRGPRLLTPLPVTRMFIEEWTVKPPIEHVPSAERIIEWIIEQLYDEVSSDAADAWIGAGENPAVLGAAESLRLTLSSRIGYVMADKLVEVHTVTWDVDGNPLLDGQPMYRKRDDG